VTPFPIGFERSDRRKDVAFARQLRLRVGKTGPTAEEEREQEVAGAPHPRGGLGGAIDTAVRVAAAEVRAARRVMEVVGPLGFGARAGGGDALGERATGRGGGVSGCGP